MSSYWSPYTSKAWVGIWGLTSGPRHPWNHGRHPKAESSQRSSVLPLSLLDGRWRHPHVFPTQQIDGGLIELGAQLVPFVGARDVAHGDLDATDNRLYVYGRQSPPHVSPSVTARSLPPRLRLF